MHQPTIYQRSIPEYTVQNTEPFVIWYKFILMNHLLVAHIADIPPYITRKSSWKSYVYVQNRIPKPLDAQRHIYFSNISLHSRQSSTQYVSMSSHKHASFFLLLVAFMRMRTQGSSSTFLTSCRQNIVSPCLIK